MSYTHNSHRFSLDPYKIRPDFPAIHSHPEIAYFDNAATTQKPKQVLDVVAHFHHAYCANPHRSNHDWAMRATLEVEKVKKQVAQFIGAKSHKNIFFVQGSTYASEVLADTFIREIVPKGGTILISKKEHTSLHEAWQRKNSHYKKELRLKDIEYNSMGTYSLEYLKKVAAEKIDLAVLTHVHNVIGLEMGIAEAREILGSTPILVDGAQSITHLPINVTKLDIQAYYFSAHKLFGFGGLGVLWVSDEYLNYFSELENGTPNTEAIISLGAAISYVESITISKIESYLLELTQYALTQMQSVPGIEYLPGPAMCSCASGHGILSFRKEGVESGELALWLNEHGIFTRAGNHCTATALTENSLRISLQIYNTPQEIDKLIQVLKNM
jgi:cysteine desulfurase / selenocysteine lyase